MYSIVLKNLTIFSHTAYIDFRMRRVDKKIIAVYEQFASDDVAKYVKTGQRSKEWRLWTESVAGTDPVRFWQVLADGEQPRLKK